ncbi:Uncharacterised protein [Halioglobus japonicus]|nr:Uncharacterised protein [Halioglobus japonicus]
MDISTSITFHVTRTGILLRRLTARKLRQAGLDITPEESVLLNQLWDRDKQGLSELAEWSVKERSTLTRQIDGLVRKGYVTRKHLSTDRRSIEVRLTTKGKGLKAKFENTGIPQLDKDFVGSLGVQPDKLLAILAAIREAALLELDEK